MEQTLSLREEKNGAGIYSFLKKIYPISQKHINDILEHMRLVLAYYIKDSYAIKHIAEENNNKSIMNLFLFMRIIHKCGWRT